MVRESGRSSPPGAALETDITHMRGTMLLTKRTGGEPSSGSQAIGMRDSTLTMRGTGMEKCSGLTDLSTEVNGIKEFRMGSV